MVYYIMYALLYLRTSFFAYNFEFSCLIFYFFYFYCLQRKELLLPLITNLHLSGWIFSNTILIPY